MRLNELDTSRLLFEDVLMDSSIQFYPNIRAMVYSNLGNVYRRMKKADAALTYFDKSDSICGYHNIDIGYLINAVNRAEVYFDFDDLTSAKKELSKAINLIETYPIPEYEAEIFRLFTRYYDVVGMPNEANAYFRKHTIILNQMKGDETKSILMEWELNNERKAHIIKTIQKELEAQNQKNQKNLALIGSAFVLMGTLFFFKSKSRKQQLTQEKILREKEKLEFNLEIRSKELLLETMKSFTVHNVKSSVEVSLTELVSNLPKMHQQRFQTLLADLRSKKEISLLKEFDQRFTSIHENFYKTLSKRGPDLTPAELRICALMRLNMTTKDISNLTQRTPGTIDNLRCSVRKKLHLQEHDNLQSYLLNL
jgi:tetratricopeptide (TPR) repeat protein